MKRICVFSDGTWYTLENPVASNVVHLTTALKTHSDDGTEQILLYDAGVGTSGGAADALFGGLMGAGIDDNIKQLYRFIAMNYNDGDEIYLFGFSRGAYTVRSLAGMLYDAGLVRRADLTFVHEAYDLYRSGKGGDSKEAREFREQHAKRANVTLLACFDTVGALGLPSNMVTSSFFNSQYAFHDVKINPTIQNAVHMVSIEENRVPFNYTPMNEAFAGQVTQKFFAGTHSAIGGGDASWKQCTRIALHFLLDEMQRRGLALEFDEGLLPPRGDVSEKAPSVAYHGMNWFVNVMVSGVKPRVVPSVDALHSSAIHRYQMDETWRPPSLKALHDDIMAADVAEE